MWEEICVKKGEFADGMNFLRAGTEYIVSHVTAKDSARKERRSRSREVFDGDGSLASSLSHTYKQFKAESSLSETIPSATTPRHRMDLSDHGCR